MTGEQRLGMIGTRMDLKLENRASFPEPLRVLLEQYPREAWEAHRNFGDLVRFWLSRHVMFRQVIDRMTEELNKVLWSGGDVHAFRPKLSRLGGLFLQELHTHHNIEDHHYFPQLIGLEPKLDHGFNLLENDHHEIDALLNGFAETANLVLKSNPSRERDDLGALEAELRRMNRCLDRHLTDEEELIVPIILKSGFAG